MPDIWAAFRAGQSPDRGAAYRSACLEVIRLSGLFDAETYAAQLAQPVDDPLGHYHDHGWRAGHRPNPYFDPAWYRARYPDVAEADTDPLLHYVSYGEHEGRLPVACFDPAWYRAHHPVPAGMHCLRHYLLHRRDGTASPHPEFDGAWYLRAYPDVAAAGMDPLEHYLVRGYLEGRDPSPRFDTRFYRLRYLRGQPEQNPLLHYLRHQGEPGVHTRMPPGETTVAREVRRFAAPGADFEPPRAAPANAHPRALALAFHLPQFHPIPQNDAWWGPGFTEWTNLGRGLPRFAGHYQPRIPRDLGHYRLDDPATLKRQVALARGAGIGGFIFHHYRFGATRLLERPVEAFLADRTIDFPFCLMWANENWTRRWDGAADEVLIAQTYRGADEAPMLADFARHFADPRYLRIAGRPLLMIYRAGAIPRPRSTIARWRARLRDAHGQHPLLVMAQSFGDSDPGRLGLDGAIEFPPHHLVERLQLINHRLDLLDPDCDAQVFDYAEAAAAAIAAPPPDFPLIRCAVPGWDNDARRQGHGMVLHGATPSRYQVWLAALVAQAVARPFHGMPLVAINAWNEWAEGAYLEPDQHYGAAFLNATARALLGADQPGRIAVVLHDAFRAGSQLLALHLVRRMRAAHGVAVEVILRGGGALADGFAAAAPVHHAPDDTAFAAVLHRLRASGCSRALVASAAAAASCPALAAHGFQVTLLVHELPGLLAERGLTETLRTAFSTIARAVFPADQVRDAIVAVAPLAAARCLVLPQGVYQPADPDPAAVARLRAAWGVADDCPLVIGMGYGDRRKGFDLFIEVWRRARRRGTAHLAWVGEIDHALRASLAGKLRAATATGRFHLPGWRDDPATVLAAADLLLLTSREDPYPSAVLEALRLGTPVACFDDSGGIPALLRTVAGTAALLRTIAGTAALVVRAGDCAALAAIAAAAPRVRARRDLLPHDSGFAPYAARLTQLVAGLPSVSVIVPCHGQAAQVKRRLDGIFAQTAPVAEIALDDDADPSHAAATGAAHAAARDRLVTQAAVDANSGSPFGCWHRAVRRAHGDLVWIAEADDDADPALLARLAPYFADPAVVLGFCDSVAVDRDGATRVERYDASYQAVGAQAALARDAVLPGAAFAETWLAERNILFNVSAVLWRRDALARALEILGAALNDWRVAGDWRLYWQVLRVPGARIAHVAAPLNRHCRDDASASARVATATHLAEIDRMHALIRADLGDPPGLADRQTNFHAEAAAFLRTGALSSR